MQTILSRAVLASLIGIALLAVLGGVALATRPAVNDFAPYTMRDTWWTATALQREGQPPEPGTMVQVLEYRNIDSWKVTTLSSSWDPGAVGTTVEVNAGSHTTFVAQARRLISRVVPQVETGRMPPFRWVTPGLMDSMTQFGFVQQANSAAGTSMFVEAGASVLARPDGTTDVVSGAVVAFDAASRLPLSVKVYRDGTLRDAHVYEILSRP